MRSPPISSLTATLLVLTLGSGCGSNQRYTFVNRTDKSIIIVDGSLRFPIALDQQITISGFNDSLRLVVLKEEDGTTLFCQEGIRIATEQRGRYWGLQGEVQKYITYVVDNDGIYPVPRQISDMKDLTNIKIGYIPVKCD